MGEDSDLRTSTSGLPRSLHDNISWVSFTLVCCRTPSPGVSIEMRLAVQRGREGLLHTLPLFRPKERVHRHRPSLILGARGKREVPGLPGDCRKHPGEAAGRFPGAEWRLTGWGQEACKRVSCGRVERDWVRLRPRDADPAVTGRQDRSRQLGQDARARPGSPGASEGPVGTWGLTSSKWHLSNLF